MQALALPIALGTTSGADVARFLIEQMRRSRLVVPGVSVVERMAATAMLEAERHIDRQLTGPLDARQTARLEALLSLHAGTNISALAWVRQPEGVAGHRSFAGIVERLEHLRLIGLDPSLTAPVHPERIRQLRASGARLSAQHLRTLRPARRRAGGGRSWSRPCSRRP